MLVHNNKLCRSYLRVIPSLDTIPPLLVPSSSKRSLLYIRVFGGLCDSVSLNSDPDMTRSWGAFTGSWGSFQQPQNWSKLPHPWTINCLQTIREGPAVWTIPLLHIRKMMGSDPCRFCAGNLSCCVFLWQQPRHAQKRAFHHTASFSYSLALFLPPFPPCSLSLGGSDIF